MLNQRRAHPRRHRPWAAMLAASAIAASGCAGVGGGFGGADDGTVTLTLATVSNPQMRDMEELKGHFEAEHPGIRVNFVQMEEQDLRAAVTADVAARAGQYDIVTAGAYEVPQWGAVGWLKDLGPELSADADYDVDDILQPITAVTTVDGRRYAVPFYGETSILMYNKRMFDEAGLEMPDRPTWEQVGDFARTLRTPDRAGICLRGKPGWGDLFAPLTTVVQTFGGNWYDEDWNATVDAPAFNEAVSFYVDLVREAGENDPVSHSYTECLNLVSNGGAAMWYDASVAASLLEDPNASPVAGEMAYTHAPVMETASSAWLWSWNLAIPATTENSAEALTFLKWATSKDYHRLVGEELGWTRVPPGARQSTYDIPEYIDAAGAFAPLTVEVMNSVNPAHPGVAPQPWVGVQYVTIPEFQDVGNQVAQFVADAIAGRTSVEDALARGQRIAQIAGDKQRGAQ